jgi:hypothetical protein
MPRPESEHHAENRRESAVRRRDDDGLAGKLFRVPDARWWVCDGARQWHPGLCVRLGLPGEALAIKGQTAKPIRYPGTYVVEPSDLNGLARTTAFDLEPRRFRTAELHGYEREGLRLGALEPVILQSIRAELERIFPGA